MLIAFAFLAVGVAAALYFSRKPRKVRAADPAPPSSPAFFAVGSRYFDETKCRAFECIAVKGKKSRRVAFGCLDSVEKDLAFLKECPEFGGFHKVRTDGGVETCQRGALRADR